MIKQIDLHLSAMLHRVVTRMRYVPILVGVPTLLLGQETKPNIIVFLVDDMGVMDTSVPFMVDDKGRPVTEALNEWYRTPNMEQLAAHGIRFNSYYAQSVSSPSRVSLMTGQNSTRHGVTSHIRPEDNNVSTYGPSAWNWLGLTKESVTLPQVLKQSGYKTIHVGKAHFGPFNSVGENPLNLGFDVNIAGSAIGQPGSYYGKDGFGHIKGNKARAVNGLEKYHGKDIFLTEALTLEAKQEMSKAVAERKPFFLHMAHYAVHAPFQADGRFLKNYEGSDKGKAAVAFATLIEGIDKSLGDIMGCLDSLGVAENTLIIFLGDNGSDAPLGNDRKWGSSAPLRGKKATEFEGGVRAPFIVSWATNSTENVNQQNNPIAAGRIQTQLGRVIDIYPTVLSVAGVQSPKGHVVDGCDMKKQLTGKYDRKRSMEVLLHYPHQHRFSYYTSYRDKEWKLIYEYNPTDPTHPTCRLYNTETDPIELTDLAPTESKRVFKMKKRMIEKLEFEQALYPVDADGNELRPIL